MKKRLLALLLCLVMVIGLVPFAFAADGDEEVKVTGLNLHFIADNDAQQEFLKLGEKYGFQQGAWSKEADAIQASEMTAPEGYHFYGWATTRNDKNTIFKFGLVQYPENMSFPYTLTLYGIWEPDQTPDPVTHTITYQYSKDDTEPNTTCTVEHEADHTAIAYPWQAPDKMVFDYWTDGYHTYKSGDTIGTVRSNMTLYAVYKDASAVLCTVKYNKAPTLAEDTFQIAVDQSVVIDPNGGAYFDATDRENNGKTDWFALPITKDTTIGTAKAAGKIFIGWVKGTYEGAADVVKLTAQWKEDTATEYTVTFYCWYHDKKNETQPFARNTTIVIDPNGGQFWYGDSYTTKTQRFNLTSNYTIANAERRGYTFYGWKATEDTHTNTVTFTAQWTKDYPYYNTYSIYYYDYDDCKSEYANFPYGTSVVIDPNGGTAKLSGTSFSTKQSFNIYRDYTLTDASRSGYTFYGWDLTKSGSTYYFTAMWSRYKSDVPYMLNGTDHYAYIKGYPNGSFKPTDTITRAEAATIFYRLLTDSTRKAYATTYNSFKDVPATAWYNTAVSTMAKLGIVNGDAYGYFRPNDPITRAEIAAMIARCDGAYYTGTSTVFSDTYGHWAAGYIDRAYELGWINGYGTTYAPDRYISRAETVAVLNRVLNRAPQYTSDLTRNYTTFSDVATSAWYYLDVEEAANSHTYTRKSNADYETWTKLIADPSWF